ncbi:DNA helicase [Devosia sp. H5989]|nr:DNA helicase [Devosia sp. H5989]
MLADAPRVGKTGTAIMAADYIFARRILVVTTASGRAVWKRGFGQWSIFPRRTEILTPKDNLYRDAEVVIVGWPSIADPKLRSQLLRVEWDVLILDEAHAAKNFEAKRTQAVFGEIVDDGATLLHTTALAAKAKAVWPLSGTPMPNSPLDLYPMLKALDPQRLMADPTRGWPDVLRFSDFQKRYVITKPKKIGHGYMARWIDVVIGGRNEDELAARLEGFVLRRTQADVGITQPIYETWPLMVSAANRAKTEAGLDAKTILAAAEAGNTKELEMHLGPLRRLTGEIKARAVVDVVKDELDNGLDKIVLAHWHRDVGAILKEGLSHVGVVAIDGSTNATERDRAEQAFLHDPTKRVSILQIQAGGEAIDQSSAAELMFVEASMVPKDMAQMALRITNHTQKRQPRVRVAVLEGSIDEALQEILLRKWSAIRKVLQ